MSSEPFNLLGSAPGADTGRAPLNRSSLMTAFGAAVALSVILPRVPYGKNVLYPFSLLGVWAHEMGHGLTAIFTGGSFQKLELYKGLGGVAYHTGAGRFTGAMVSAGGLLGPAIFGALIIVFASKPKTSRFVLPVLAVMVALSVVFFVRNAFGAVAMSLIAAIMIPIGFKAGDVIRVFVAQLIGIQFCLASWGTWDYLFTDKITIDGRSANSDTGQIADALFLPYWFWGFTIAALSAAILVFAFYRAWIRPFANGAGESGLKQRL